MSEDPAQNKKPSLKREISNILTKLAANPVWDESLPLKVLKKRIIDYNDELLANIEEDQKLGNSSREVFITDESPAEDECKIYIVIHHVKGNDMNSWARVISSLSHSSHGRPIYDNESAAQKLLSTKSEKDKDGYVEVWVKKSDIINLPKDRILYDKFGHHLLSIDPKAIEVGGVKFFYHISGRKYKFYNLKLILVN